MARKRTAPAQTESIDQSKGPPGQPPEGKPTPSAPAPEAQEGARVIEVPSLVEDNLIAEPIFRGRKPEFGVWNGSAFSIAGKIEHNGFEYCPPQDRTRLIQERVILLPSDATPYGTQEELIGELKQFIHDFADVPAFWEELIAHYSLLTWCYDRFGALPYLRFLGENGTGKTRLLEVTRELCCRSLMISGASSVASIFRIINTWRGTLSFDEADFRDSQEWSEIVKIFNNGYMAGIPVLRADGENFEPRPYYVFGPKILSTRQRFGDSALESRCLTYETIEKKIRPDIPLDLVNTDSRKRAAVLRNKLLRWRLENLRKINAGEQSALRGQSDNRLAQIGSQIYAISTDDGFKQRLIEFLQKYGTQEKSQRPQAIVLEAISRALVLKEGQNPFEEIDSVLIKEITSQVDQVAVTWGLAKNPYDRRSFMSAKRVGTCVRSLGFTSKRTNQGYEVEIDREKLAARRLDYGLTDAGISVNVGVNIH